MSTRSNLIVRVRENKTYNGYNYLQYYHHCDGYLSGVGVELIQTCLKMLTNYEIKNNKTSIEAALRDIFSLRWEQENSNTVHADIEYLYLIDVDISRNLTLSYIECTNDYYNSDYDYNELYIKNHEADFQKLLRLKSVKYEENTYHSLDFIDIKI